MDFILRYLCFAGLTLGSVAWGPARLWRPGLINTTAMAVWFVLGGLIFLA